MFTYVVFCRSDIARKYKAKKSEIELKRTELMRLNQEYETKMRSKEVGRIGLCRISYYLLFFFRSKVFI